MEGQGSDSVPQLPLAICGVGSFARKRLLPALTKCRNVRLAALIHPSRTTEPPAGIEVFEALEAYLETKPTGVVYIASPNHLHAPQAILCLTAGVPVLCEKPLATNSIDGGRAIEVARGQGTPFRVGHMLRFSPALRCARDWIREGRIGRLLSVEMEFLYELPRDRGQWAFGRKTAGGGVLMDAGIHCVDALRFLLGTPIEPVAAGMDLLPTSNGVEREAVGHLRVAGLNCRIRLSSRSSYRTRLKGVGTKGILVVHRFAACWGNALLEILEEKTGQALEKRSVDVSTTYTDQIDDFASTIQSSTSDLMQALEALENVRVIEGLYAIAAPLCDHATP